jgi:hypothetical protein
MMESDMAVGRERKYKEEEFKLVFHSNACKLTEDVEFARMYNITAFEYDEMEGVHEFDKAFDAVKLNSGAPGGRDVQHPWSEGGLSV